MGKTKCVFDQCNKRAVLITGFCNYCNNNYCNKHRLPEDHICPEMNKCQKDHFDRNMEKLINQKSNNKKVIITK